MPKAPQRKSDPEICYDDYFGEVISALEVLHGPDDPLRWFHFEVLRTALSCIQEKTLHRSHIARLHKAFAECADAAETPSPDRSS